MKTFKLNFAFLCMLALITVSVCLTSCGKENIATDQDTNITSANEIEDGQYGIFIPEEISEQGEAQIEKYVKNLSDEQRIEQINNFIKSNFISKKVQESDNSIEAGTVKDFSQANLSDYLSNDEINELNSLLINSENIESRYCIIYLCYYCCGNVFVECGVSCYV